MKPLLPGRGVVWSRVTVPSADWLVKSSTTCGWRISFQNHGEKTFTKNNLFSATGALKASHFSTQQKNLLDVQTAAKTSSPPHPCTSVAFMWTTECSSISNFEESIPEVLEHTAAFSWIGSCWLGLRSEPHWENHLWLSALERERAFTKLIVQHSVYAVQLGIPLIGFNSPNHVEIRLKTKVQRIVCTRLTFFYRVLHTDFLWFC